MSHVHVEKEEPRDLPEPPVEVVTGGSVHDHVHIEREDLRHDMRQSKSPLGASLRPGTSLARARRSPEGSPLPRSESVVVVLP